MKPTPSPCLPVLALSASLAAAGFAGELRPLSTDRPDTTESAYSVDPGHFQFETELAAFTRDGGEWTEYALAEINAKYGLTRSSDIQFVIPSYINVRNGPEGFGDMEVRLKYNVWGNDGGDTAFALMPFVKLPTASDELGNGEMEGGLIAPFAFSAPNDWSCAVMGEIDVSADEGGGGHHLVGVVTATAGHDITANTAGFVEVVGIFSADDAEDTEAYFNCGITWAITETWQLDGGLRVGLTDAAADLTPFLGLSAKF